MQELIERIKTEGVYVGGGIVKVDGFLNHQVDSVLLSRIGNTFAERFATQGVDTVSKIITAESSGILPALTTAQALKIPMIYARKRDSASMTDEYFRAQAVSRTRGDQVTLAVSQRYLKASDRILIIDDFLASGSTLSALVEIVQSSGAQLLGIGCVIEKPVEGGRARMAHLNIPIITLAKIDWRKDHLLVSE